MTAIGLFVAVPAVMGYNWLLGRNKLLQDALAELRQRPAATWSVRAHGERGRGRCASGGCQGGAEE